MFSLICSFLRSRNYLGENQTESYFRFRFRLKGDILGSKSCITEKKNGQIPQFRSEVCARDTLSLSLANWPQIEVIRR